MLANRPPTSTKTVIEKTVTSTAPILGGYPPESPITYRIEVTNPGIANAADVQLAETLDPAMILQSITRPPRARAPAPAATSARSRPRRRR